LKPSWRKAVVERGSGNGFVLSGAGFCELLTAALEKGKTFRFKAGGVSMSPFIKDGDFLTVAPFTGGRRPRLGDITAVKSRVTGNLLVHRIVRLDGNTCRIKADNMPVPDGLFPIDSLLGFVSHLERDQRRIHIHPGVGNTLVALFSRIGLIPIPLSIMKPLRFVLKFR